MNTRVPTVSIITPAYNAEKYIAEAIDSVLHQSYSDWELLVIDDGSTDNTAAIVRAFGDGRIILIQQENSGVSKARNKGLELAKGIYITFLDADDVLPPNSLKDRVEYLESHPDVDVVDGKIHIKDAEMEATVRIYEPYYEGRLLPRLLALDSRVFFNVCYLFRHKLLGTLRFKEEMSHAEDLLFYMELCTHDTCYGYVNEAVYNYRSGHASAMQNLQGLENGYRSLITYVSALPTVSLAQKITLRLKVMKIMVLSWMGEKQYAKAIRSIFSIMGMMGK